MRLMRERHIQSPHQNINHAFEQWDFFDFGKVAQFRFIEVEGLFRSKAIYGIKPFIFTNHHLLLLLFENPKQNDRVTVRFCYVC